ncbi:MAG: hypothetical protein M9894_00555 [Planctomycetes bacterium]|nr:hypothetical protein [Planctomycetota bacterium]
MDDYTHAAAARQLQFEELAGAMRAIADEFKAAAVSGASAPSTETLRQTCVTWDRACNALEREATEALGLRPQVVDRFRIHAQTIWHHYVVLTDYHSFLAGFEAVEVREILRIHETFLSASQQVVALGAPEFIPALKELARSGSYPTCGIETAEWADRTDPWVDRAIARAGLGTYPDSYQHLASSWAIGGDSSVLEQLQKALLTISAIGAAAARLALPQTATEANAIIAQGVASATRGDDAEWDAATREPEVGRRSKRAHVRWSVCAALMARLQSAEAHQFERDAAALSVIALAVETRGDLFQRFCGGGGFVRQIERMQGLVGEHVWQIAYLVEPRELSGAAGVSKVEDLLGRIREAWKAVQSEAFEATRLTANGTPSNDPPSLPAEGAIPEPARVVKKPGVGAWHLLTGVLAVIVLAGVQAAPFFSDGTMHFAVTLAWAAIFPVVAVLLQVLKTSDEQEKPGWLSTIRERLAILLLLEAVAVVLFIWAGLNLYEPALKWKPLKDSALESPTFWSVVNPAFARLAYSTAGGEALTSVPSVEEKIYLANPLGAPQAVAAAVFARHFLAMIVWVVGLRLVVVFMVLLRGGGGESEVLHWGLLYALVFFGWLALRLTMLI